MRLATYLAAPRPPFDYCASDCCRWVAAWVAARGHGDPIAAIQLSYDSEIGALRRVKEAGGLVPLWSAAMALLALPDVDEPVIGAVGIIQCEDDAGLGEVAGIHTGERWVTLGKRGLDFSPAVPLRAWRV